MGEMTFGKTYLHIFDFIWYINIIHVHLNLNINLTTAEQPAILNQKLCM